MTGMLLGMAVLISSAGVPPAQEPSRARLDRAAINFELPADGAILPEVRQSSRQAVQPAPVKRFSKVDRVIAVAAGVCLGWVAGGAMGYVATADHGNPDDDTSGLRGLIIGAPIGAALGAVLGYRLTK